MRHTRPITRYAILCSLLLGLVLTGTVAADEVARVSNVGNALVFSPLVPFNQLILTVTGPCNFRDRQVVTEGEAVFQLSPETIDGRYRYELVVIPSIDPGIVEILQHARATGDNSEVDQLCRAGKLPGDPLTQAEGFLVAFGEIVFDPGSFEKEVSLEKPAATDSPIDWTSVVTSDAAAQGPSTPAKASSNDPAAKDFVIIDDLIVDGSACIGFDCVNGESFGFDTIRLKENNLRIKFDDTSTAASFPRNDWQITANDSANGGASKFSIDDISGSRTPFTIEANARSHSLYVDDGGRIGSRTSTPSTEIHTVDGDTPTLRLQQDGSSGFAPQTWDVAGNETNFFIRDVTNGSTLPFRIRPGAPTSSIDIAASGNVGIGTASPTALLEIQASADNGGRMRFDETATGDEWEMGGGAGNSFVILDPADAAEFILNSAGNLTITGTITTSGSCSIGCDGVFQPDHELESIEEHASAMWENGYLPAVGAVPDQSKTFNISNMTTGMLNELEKAHIYIEQLHGTIKELSGEMQEMKARLEKLETPGTE